MPKTRRVKIVRSADRKRKPPPVKKTPSADQIAQQKARETAASVGGWIKKWRQQKQQEAGGKAPAE